MNLSAPKILFLGCAVAALTAASAAQQQSTPAPASQSSPSQQDQYQGQSTPPADDIITTAQPDQPKPKPSPSHPMEAPQPAPVPVEAATPAPTTPAPTTNQNAAQQNETGDDNGIVQVAPPTPQPALVTRSAASDPDGDIVHPAPLPPGTLEEGTQIRVRLLTELSSTRSEKGDEFRGRVDSDVLQDGIVLIPAGSEITGKVVEANSGHFAGHGTLRLRPETVTLPNGQQYSLMARVTATENSHTRADREGTIESGSRAKRDGVEYGGGVGVGLVTGAVVGGPVGALAGGLIGAGAVTVHLMMDHPQATLEPGATLVFTLSDRLALVATPTAGN